MNDMIRTIYRGYDITAEQPNEWRVYDPAKPGTLLAVLATEDAACKFVDGHKREQRK